ncbi:MAG TPA: hypothetical protein VKV22_14490 [Rhodanobacteraceae bacterium]|nr:hypothetical protein [Rhodanobacteraceae bacterium]
MRLTASSIGCAFALLGAGCPFVAGAVPPTSHGVAAVPSSTKPARAGGTLAGFGPSVAPAALANLSGGSNVTQSISINGSVSNNSTENVGTGMNWIGGGAFGNAAGLSMVIQNSGNSVLIQNATVVNVQMQP